MKIIQVADLHVGENISNARKIVEKLINSVCSHIVNDDYVALCICGDVIDRGSIGNIDAKYQNASEIVKLITNALESKKCIYKIFIVPGNHDIQTKKKPLKKSSFSFEKFCDFAVSITKNSEYKEFTSSSVINFEFGGINWILCNSAYHGDRSFGNIEIDNVQARIISSDLPSIIMTHHTIFSVDSEDSSALRNGYRLINTAEKNSFAILHGHVHGYKSISVGKTCHVIGVGPLLKQVNDINKQVNVIELSSQGVCRVTNIFYRDDMEVWSIDHNYADRTTYHENDICRLVKQVQTDARYANSSSGDYMYNVIMRYRAKFETFCEQINSDFFKSSLEMAKLWQQEECPNELYFNHGTRIYASESMDYIKRTLTKNPTSRRALVSLIDQQMVQGSKDNYLPSFDLVQFSFPDNFKNTLNISLYMRSLEASVFLPINLCELYLMALQLEEYHLVAPNIDIAIFTHCVSHIEGFDGFKKSELDVLSEHEIQDLVVHSDYEALYNLLYEKSKKRETVLHNDGVYLLLKVIKNSNIPEFKPLESPLYNLSKSIDQTRKKRKANSSLYDSRTKRPDNDLASMNKAYAKVLDVLIGLQHLK